jgi:hypothetical protein
MPQNYISDILFHFVGRNLQKEEDQYLLLKKIIQEGWISFPPHEQQISPGYVELNSMRTRKLEEMVNPKCVCFSDIPKNEIALHIKKYSKFGLGFVRDFLLLKGANPVFYIEENSIAFVQSDDSIYEKRNMKEYYQENFSKTIFYFMMHYLPYTQRIAKEKQSEAELRDTWKILHFLINVSSHFKPWNDKLEETDPNNFYYEREWRALNNINFSLSDIKVICLPKSYIKRFKEDFSDYNGEIESIEVN